MWERGEAKVIGKNEVVQQHQRGGGANTKITAMIPFHSRFFSLCIFPSAFPPLPNKE